jgi:hypothetical protein
MYPLSFVLHSYINYMYLINAITMEDREKIELLEQCGVHRSALGILDDIHEVLLDELKSQKHINERLKNRTSLLTKWLLFFVNIFSIAHRNLESPYLSRLSLKEIFDEIIERINQE